MSDAITITTLVENTVNIGGLRGEHGLAFLIRSGRRKLLFDTGQNDLILQNAQRMGLPLEDVSGIILSLGHYDHTGGLDAICKIAPRAQIFLHPAAVEPKFTKNADGTCRSIGTKPESLAVIRRADLHLRPNQPANGGSGPLRSSEGSQPVTKDVRAVVWTRKPQEVMAGIWVTGEIPRRTSFEDTGGRFY